MTHPRSNDMLGVPAAISAQGAWLRAVPVAGLSDAERVDALRGLEELKNTAAALQARVAVDLDASQREEQRLAGVPAAKRGLGVAGQVGLARRESPHRAAVLLGLAKVLRAEMPHTSAAFEAGVISEFRAQVIVRETACLTLEDRQAVDRLVAGDPERLSMLGTRELASEVKQHAYRLDPHSVVDRASQAAADRTVTLRPAPDCMTYLTALLPVKEGVAAYAALTRAADQARATGNERSRGQVMADTLVERLTGQASADAVPVGVHLVMTDRALFDHDTEPAHVISHGPIPAGLARDLIGTAPELGSWVKRLYTDDGGQLIAMESRQRAFPAGLAEFITVRDRTCRTPWCDAPIRAIDHIRSVADGGTTSAANGQGLCEACNYAKEAPGWQYHSSSGDDPPGPPGSDPPERQVTTPTGTSYPIPKPPPWPVTRPPGVGGGAPLGPHHDSLRLTHAQTA